ncbi:MAG: competence/damage-inducible protein A [Candidatus Aerophobetes bacterium]|nr:competence/damage-inducible protein A [Candidatus Aerophobetes bacterium]
MEAEIISVGTELLLGDVVDTNAAYIAGKLSPLGIDLFRKTVVGDNKERLSRILKGALDRVDLIITNGGLGPTEDDLTKEVISEVMEEKLIVDEEIAKNIKRRFSSKNLPEKAIIKQALIPSSAKIIANESGSAPGIILEKKSKIIISLPGVPREMKKMMEGVSSYLSKKEEGKERIKSRFLKIWGIGESQVEEKIADILKEQSNPTIALLAKEGEVHLRITAKFDDRKVRERKIKESEDKIRERLGDYIYGVDEETLESLASSSLRKRDLKLGVAESCTGGLLSHRLTNIPGSSNYYNCGVVSYSNQAKSELLNIFPSFIQEKGAVSSEVAEKMAEGAKKAAKADIGIGITGIAGPTGATPEKPVGLVYIALSTQDKKISQKFIFSGNREKIKWKASQAALYLLYKSI